MDNPMIGTLLFPSTSDDDDPHHLSTTSAAKNPSPWHRMKWTDDIVRLLITLVSSVGDDAPPCASASSAIQKKGKWKTVSKMMLDKGCYVSPQQCEDKFNDLNKRYKRLNELLGRGTTCQVVENPSLLDSMPHVSAKSKDDVRKILSSKHLFYREMCAYHNGQRIPNPNPNGVELEEEEEEKDLNFKDSDESSSEEEGERLAATTMGLGIEIDGLSVGQKSEWLRKRRVQLMEERVEIETEGFELAKRRAKWERFKSKKDWEMERVRVENKRLMLENERMLLQVRRNEVELDEHGRAL